MPRIIAARTVSILEPEAPAPKRYVVQFCASPGCGWGDVRTVSSLGLAYGMLREEVELVRDELRAQNKAAGIPGAFALRQI